MADDRYRLIDFGDGRKLESVAGRLIDRVSPAAETARPQSRELWQQAVSRFCSNTKKWIHREPWPDDLVVNCDGFVMPVRPTPFGHIGLFPEQFENWRWLRSHRGDDVAATQKSALNLFGYTGASSMALASVGYQVAHVDAAKPNVQSAGDAAKRNGWADYPIRYLVDDAAKFVAREVRRNKRYDTIVLDPPAYGHSPKGKAWRLERDLWPLLENCISLVDPTDFRMLITGHSPDVNSTDVVDFVGRRLKGFRSSQTDGRRIESGRSQLVDRTLRKLDAGFYVRIECRPDAFLEQQ
ncbi:MAG: class I SAM-dependent methyltransferase [Pirellulaceae bacterium]